VVAVSSDIAADFSVYMPEMSTVTIPAYIAYEADSEDSFISSKTDAFLNRDGVTLILSAYRIREFAGSGGDIYGVDIASKLFTSLAPQHIDLRLAIFLALPPRGRWARHFVKCHIDRLESEWPDRVLVAIGERLTPAFQHSVIYLRPSRTDGDAVSIREALAAEVPVLASDVAERPGETQIVAIADHHAWIDGIRELVSSTRERRKMHPSHTSLGSQESSPMLELYTRHLRRRPIALKAIGGQ
jgi:glycosyltransferase involved in cell wall biosynthesis